MRFETPPWDELHGARGVMLAGYWRLDATRHVYGRPDRSVKYDWTPERLSPSLAPQMFEQGLTRELKYVVCPALVCGSRRIPAAYALIGGVESAEWCGGNTDGARRILGWCASGEVLDVLGAWLPNAKVLDLKVARLPTDFTLPASIAKWLLADTDRIERTGWDEESVREWAGRKNWYEQGDSLYYDTSRF